MGDGLFVIGLGAVLIFLGLIRNAARILKADMPKSTGYLRGQEIGAYFALGLGAVLILVGIGVVIVDAVA